MRRGKRGEQFTGLDIALFDPGVLRTDEGVERAFGALDAMIYRPDVDGLVEQLLSKKGLFEYVLSSCSEATADIFISNIMSRFSVVLCDFLSSIPHRLLQRLPRFLYFLPYENNQQPARLSQYQTSIELEMNILTTLTANSPVGESINARTSARESAGNKTESTQRAKKQARKASKSFIQNAAPFDLAGLQAPKTAEDASLLVVEILSRHQAILRDLLEVLRGAATRDLVRAAYVFDSKLSAPYTETKNKKGTSDSVIVEQATEGITQPDPAYPVIQPMKSSLYFENADGFGEWPIHISGRAGRDLRSHRKNGPTFGIILKKLKELSNAHFSEDNQKKLNHHDHEVPIFEAKMTRDLRLVYQIDCIAEGNYERQIIRVYGVYTHAHLENNRLWDSVSCHLMSKRGKDYRDKCIYRNMLPNHRVAPAYFPPSAGPSEEDNTQSREPHQEDLEELHSLLVLDKFVVFSQAYLNNVIADQDATYPFDVSPQEQQIIEHPSSCYVIGRSGTGKTTTMMFKMLAIEKTHSETDFLSVRSKPRQIFVTQSRHLAQRVEDYFQKLLTALEAGGKSAEEVAATARRKAKDDPADLIDDEDIENWRNDLPGCFSKLEDRHFPLFVTFDRLCSLIEKDLELSFSVSPADTMPNNIADRRRRAKQGEGFPSDMAKDDDNMVAGGLQFANKHTSSVNASFVTYEVFESEYWSHFSQSLTKGLDPVLVFNEFLGVIKGSEKVLDTEQGFLNRAAYLEISTRSHALFASQRQAIYSLFELYQKRKRAQRQFDAADRTITILRGIEQGALLGRKADFLYVDEVQDNLLTDAKLLRLVCNNPNGRFWAGDTAQTISMGSAFRLNELRAMLYRHENTDLRLPVAEQPPLFQLTMNYRSHGGIVDCASSVIDILSHFWPDSLDTLAKETGSVSGIKPIFFTDWDQDSVRYEQFLFGDADTGQHIEFGATQCILVRDDKARDRLREQVGDIGVIMTLYESKGLEFNDVLLYNFFADSLVGESQWRVVLNMLQDPSTPPPAFDDLRHAGVCHELKCLYVAITRGRKNVWIVDSSERSEPMKLFWTDSALVQICTPTSGVDLPRLAVSSTSEEWAETGRTLFRNKRYWQAMHCFERGNMLLEKDVAYAYHMRVQARLVPRTTTQCQNRKAAFIVAADAFRQCIVRASPTSAVRATYLKNAGDCFLDAEDASSAAVAYYDAGLYTRAVECYRKVGMFDEAVKVIEQHSGSPSLEETVAERVMVTAKIQYFKTQQLEKAAKLFDNVNDQLDFVDEWELDVAQATLLESVGRFYDAAELHKAEGREEKAMELYLSGLDDTRAVHRATECILISFRKLFYVGVSPPKADPSLEQLREYVRRLKSKLKGGLLHSNDQNEIMLFLALANNDRGLLVQLLPIFEKAKNSSIQLLLLENLIKQTPDPKSVISLDMVRYLDEFEGYLNLMLRVAALSRPHESVQMQQAFGFRLEAPDNLVVLPKDSIFCPGVPNRGSFLQGLEDEGIRLPVKDFQVLFKNTLISRVRDCIRQENAWCRRTRVLHSCLQFALSGHCGNSEFCPREHLEKEQLSVEWYNSRIRLRFQQILILQRSNASSPFRERAKEQLFWLENLCDAFFPLFPALGHFVNIKIDKIPEATRAAKVLLEWLRTLFFQLQVPARNGYTVEGYSFPQFLSILIKTSALAFAVDTASAKDYITAAPAVKLTTETAPPIYRRPAKHGSSYIVHDALGFLHGQDPQHIQAGCLLLKYILKTNLSMDAAALCLLVDRVFGAVIFHGSYSYRRSLHGIIIPRSWALSFLQTFNSMERMLKFTYALDDLVSELGELLQRLITDNSDALYFEKSRLGLTVRNVVIARVCFALSILGDNPGFAGLRTKIFRVINAAGSKFPASLRHPRIYRDYMEARDWVALSRVGRQSYGGSQLDELVHFCHDSPGQRSLPVLLGARRITYKKLDELPRLLNPSHGLVQLVSHLNASAATFEPRQVVTAITSASENQIGTPPPSAGYEIEDVDEDQEGQIGGWSHANSSFPWSDSHVKAVKTVLKYRRLKNRRQFSTARELTRFEMTRKYHEAAATMEWPHTYYRALFRGLVPILRVCIDDIHSHIVRWKARAKKQFMADGHEELEKCQDELTQIKPLLKETNDLKKAVEEGSKIHRQRSVDELKALVQRTHSLIPQVPNLDRRYLDQDVLTCLKAIVQPTVPPKRKEVKPTLNMDDLDGFSLPGAYNIGWA